MSELEKVSHKSEEIDLIALFRPVAQGAARLIDNYFRRLWLSKWTVIAIIVVFGLIGYSLRFVLPARYRSEAIFATDPRGLNAEFCSLLINDINNISSKGDNVHVLETLLKLKPGSAVEIQSMSAVVLNDKLFSESRDSSVSPVSLFQVTLTVKSKEVVNDIQEGIVNYLENNEYALKRKESRRKTLMSLNEDYLQKLASLDSLKKLVNSSVVPRSTGQGIILGQPINPVDVYKEQTIYYQAMLKNKEELENINNIEILQPFLLPDNYNYPDFKKLLFLFLAAGILAALILAPIRKG